MRLNNALSFCYRKQSRGWPPERRLKHAASTRAAKLWQKSTGPQTRAGKAKSAQNATKSGLFNAGWQVLRKAFTLYRRFLKWANMVLKNPILLADHAARKQNILYRPRIPDPVIRGV